jgi:DNA-binding CsgD family transcriptional regulator
MRHEQMSLLTETIYDAAVDPGAWAQVMQLLKQNLSSGVEGLYFLDSNTRSMKSVHVGGLTEFYRRTFEECYFTNDNPWRRSEPLHRPGIVRTDDRLAEYFRDPHILRSSQYYNEWMKPQGVDHSLGTTLLSEGGMVANLTLLRSADVGNYSAEEVAGFKRICGHLRRALRVAMRLESVTARGHMTTEAFDCLPYGAAFLDVHGKLIHCNAVAETLIGAGNGLTLRNGRLVAVDVAEQRKLRALLQRFAHDPAGDSDLGPESMTVGRRENARPLILSAIRLSVHRRAFITAQPTILLLIVDPETARPTEIGLIRQLYQLTQTEARLAQALLTGNGLKQAADEAGITYETGRWYLKILFQKTDTRRQAQLVARLLADTAARLNAPHRDRVSADFSALPPIGRFDRPQSH